MNSLEIIKTELVNQKKLLEQKGITVNTVNTNPSPSEITAAIDSINLDFSISTATEEDVKAGKTFFSQTNELKTGTFDQSFIDNLYNKIACLVSATGSTEIEIPSSITTIRSNVYQIKNPEKTPNLFYKENLTIPENIATIQEYAFNYANLTGLLTIPNTCESIANYAFAGTNITELKVYGGLTSSSGYVFAYSNYLKKATFYEPVSDISGYAFTYCHALEELYWPTTMTSFPSTTIRFCESLKFVKFTRTKPVTFANANVFQYATKAVILVPYLHYDTYFNASNYQAQKRAIHGHGDFEQNEHLPESIEGYSIVWYATFDDLIAATNPVTICPQTGTMYAILTSTAAEETETT